MKSIRHSRLFSPLEQRNWRVAWANLRVNVGEDYNLNLNRCENQVWGQILNRDEKSTNLKFQYAYAKIDINNYNPEAFLTPPKPNDSKVQCLFWNQGLKQFTQVKLS